MAIWYPERNIWPLTLKVSNWAEFASFAAWTSNDLIGLNKSNF